MPVTPGVPGADLPPGDDYIIRKIQELERAVRELSAANPLATAGLVPSPNKLTVQGELDVNGPMVVSGTLSLPAGIINNAALTSPVVVGSQSTAETNFTVPNTSTIRAAGTIAIPAGCTTAIVNLSVYAGAVDSVGSLHYLYVSAVINGTAGHEGIGGNDPASSLIWVSASSTLVSVLTGLTPGGTISIGANLRTSDTGPWGANTSNRAYCDAMAIFLR